MRRPDEVFLYSYPKEKILLRVALIFPQRYEIGMASLGFQGVYHLLQSYPFLSVERFFYEGDVRPLSYETGRPLEEFDVMMASLSFEVDVVVLVRMLLHAGIPLLRKERKAPPLVVGGIGCTLVAGYLREIADVVVVTDAELALLYLVEAFVSGEGWEKRLKTKEGIFLAEDIGTHHLSFCSHPVEVPLHTVILTPENEFPMRGLIEVSRSCLYQCAFCLVSHLYGKYQSFSREKIRTIAQHYAGHTTRIGLVAATLTNHPEFEGIIDDLNAMGFELSFSAFRVETLSSSLLDKIIANEKKTLVLAPEAASERMKRVIRKMIPNEIFLKRVEEATKVGIKRLKLYFLVGLPGETEDDLIAMVDLIKRMVEISKSQAKIFGYVPEVIVDVNPLVPKPFTALAGMEMEDVKQLKKKIRFLKQQLHGLGRVFVSGESPRRARLQYDLSWGKLSLHELWKLSEEDSEV
ncbi:B12-binding domain-containing radical SAM protein [Thermospira aquatica]|uniref:Radical SAM protein n=1 Tax=Thermospira aquatica TaxID=2828656 RepID=A0AAX3BAW8_9SPIR|nr:radical SAM protein [Thermospira aquatica]URA09442.1 radical SAM protein [Thermospira aquatica]